MRKEYKCFVCKDIFNIDDLTIAPNNKKYCSECYKIYQAKQENNRNKENLIKYMRVHFLNKLPINKDISRRIHSMRAGKMINRGTKIPFMPNEGINYKIILLTCIYNKDYICREMTGKTFLSTTKRFNFVCSIVESKIPSTIAILERKKREKKVLNSKEIERKTKEINNCKYVKQEKQQSNNLKQEFESLW